MRGVPVPSGREARDDDGVLVSVGMLLVAVRGRSGRVWRVEREVHAGMWLLAPEGADVVPAKGASGRWQGGVRSIRRTTAELRDCQMWREQEDFPAPREDDCAYGCCKAGDVGLYSEVVLAEPLRRAAV